jgi:hypothetical protein
MESMYTVLDTEDCVLLKNNKFFIKKIACSCGFNGKTLFKKCPKCKKETTVDLCEKFTGFLPIYSGKIIDIVEKNESIIARFKIFAYHKTSKNGFSVTSFEHSIITCLKTGVLTIKTKEDEDTLFSSHPTIPDSLRKLEFDGGFHFIVSENFFLEEYFRLALTKRGVYIPDNFTFKLRTISTLLQYPCLQHFPWAFEWVPFPNFFDRVYGEELKNAESLKDATDIFLKRKSTKEIRKMAMNNSYLLSLNTLSPYLKNNDLLKKLTYKFEDVSDVNPFLFLGDEDSLKYYHIALKKIASFHFDETTFAYRLGKFIDFLSSKKDDNKVPFTVFTDHLMDIGRMILDITRRKPDFLFQFNGDIAVFHDDLARELTRLKYENTLISYSNEENLLESKVNSYQFKLARDTHELIDIGNKLRICVGSYGEMATAKESIIVIVLENKSPVACVEIKNNRIIQAKLHHNELPFGKLKDLIIQWAIKNQLNYENCYDLL